MRRSLRNTIAAALCLLLSAIIAYHLIPLKSPGELSEFTSDGCSLFPDSSRIDSRDWCRCCFAHDIAYWRGGTEADRLAADEALRQCVLEATGDATLAEAMYLGVRFGGSPYFKNWYRWGYGWSYARKYGPLSAREQALADAKLAAYLVSDAPRPCD